MAKKRKKPASRGSVNKVILKTLLTGNKYGYEIIKEVEKDTNGKVVIKQPSLYSSLSRFEAKGYVTSYWEDSDIGGRRHYYSLTALGKDYYYENFADEDEEIEGSEKSQEIKLEISNDDNIDNATNKSQENHSSQFTDNSKITNENFDCHIQDRIRNLLDTVEDLDFETNDNKIDIKEEKIENETKLENIADKTITEVNKENTENQTVEKTVSKEIVAEEDLNEILTKEQEKLKAKEDILKSTAKLAEQVAQSKSACAMTNKKEDELENETILDAEIIEEVSDSNVHVNPISILDSYKDFTLENPTPTDISGEVSDRIKELKGLYDEIKTQGSKIENVTKSDSGLARRPLTLLEKQRRLASMEKLYGTQIDLFEEKPSINQISEHAEKVNILSPNFQIEKIEVKQTSPIEPNSPSPIIKHEINTNIEKLKETAKENNSKLAMLSKSFHSIKPEPEIKTNEQVESDEPARKFYTDENGIVKLINDSAKKPKRIIDNVIYRNDNFGNNISAYKEPVKPAPAPSKIASPIYRKEIQLSAKEREERIKQFDKRFQNLTQNQIEKKKKALHALNILQNLHNTKDNRYQTQSPVKSYTYGSEIDDPIVFEGNIKEAQTSTPQPVKQEDVRSDIEKVEQPQINELDEAKDKPSSILSLQKEMQEKNLTFKSYSNEDYFNQPDIKFVLANKVKFVFGWIILFLMLAELSSFIFVLNKFDLLFPEDTTILKVAFAVIVVIALSNIFPYFLNKNKRKSNNFNLTHSLLFGIFAFFLVAIITYAINTLFGFDLENFNFYVVKLITPLVLAFNFIISPFIYKLLLNRKTFY